MGWRYRRSVKLLPGVKLNLSKNGVSTTLGVRRMHYTIGKKGKRTITCSTPFIKGLYFAQTYNKNTKKYNKQILREQTSLYRYNRNTALILCVFLGFFGIHQFYIGRKGKGFIYLFTLGIFGIGWILDIILILLNKFKDIQKC